MEPAQKVWFLIWWFSPFPQGLIFEFQTWGNNIGIDFNEFQCSNQTNFWLQMNFPNKKLMPNILFDPSQRLRGFTWYERTVSRYFESIFIARGTPIAGLVFRVFAGNFHRPAPRCVDAVHDLARKTCVRFFVGSFWKQATGDSWGAEDNGTSKKSDKLLY